MNPTVTYLRVSTAKQEVLQQDLACSNYCKFMQGMEPGVAWTDTSTIKDTDVSGTKPFHERPGGLAILQAAERGEIQRLVVAKVDRLGRNTISLMNTIQKLQALKVEIHFLDIQMRTDSPVGQCILTILVAFAELERNRIVERINDRLDAKRTIRTIPGSFGEMCGKDAPYGFQAIETSRTTRSGKPIYELLEDPNELQWLRVMVQMRYGETPVIEDGKLAPHPDHRPISYPRIAKALQGMGATSKTGKAFVAGIVESYLSNAMTRIWVQERMLSNAETEPTSLLPGEFAPGEEEALNRLLAV